MRLLLTVSLLFSTAVFGQNTCAYPISQAQGKFKFCLTSSGTLQSLPSSVLGSNAVEGWAWVAHDAQGGTTSISAFPGEGVSFPAQTVTQPHGSGTLPITFNWNGFSETVTANAVAKSITFRMSIKTCTPCTWFGGATRAANIRANGKSQNYLGSSSAAAIGYLNDGINLTGKCVGVASDVNVVNPEDTSCGVPQPTLLQQGAIYANSPLTGFNGSTSTFVWTYSLF